MRRPTIGDRLRYRFDTLMSRGTAVLIVCLWLASAALILVVAAAVTMAGLNPPAAGGRPASFAEVAWICLMRTLDGGTMGQDTGTWGYLLAMLAVTTFGILITGTLIGILTSGIDQRIQEMRKGRSFVIERNHVVVLGWSDQIHLILRELLRANESDPRFRAVVLAPRDKVEMEDSLRRRLDRRQLAKTVCRTGDPTDLKDLEIVNPEAARAVIVMPGDAGGQEARTVQAVMALTTGTGARVKHIVTEASDAETQQLLELVAPKKLQVVASGDLVARLAAQACRQPGLAAVYHDLLDFEGNEIYLGQARDVSGRPFGEALLAFADAIPIGLLRAGGAVELNPPMTARITDGDQLIAIASGPSGLRFTGPHSRLSDASLITSRWDHLPRERRAERTLLLGWNAWSAKFLTQLDRLVPPGSSVVVLAERLPPEAAGATLSNLVVEHRAGSAADRGTVATLGVDAFDHVLVVADTGRLTPDAADARSLTVLLGLREIAARCAHRFSVTCEILIEKNREVLVAAGVDDLISSAQVASLMMTQVIQNREISRVFESLFDPAGSEFYLKPVEKYVTLGAPVDFNDVILAAREHGEVAVGYRLTRDRGGLMLNPVKTDCVGFEPGDRLVVLAED